MFFYRLLGMLCNLYCKHNVKLGQFLWQVAKLAIKFIFAPKWRV